jgi:hypothetical protein
LLKSSKLLAFIRATTFLNVMILQKILIFVKKLLRRIFGPKGDEVTDDCRNINRTLFVR